MSKKYDLIKEKFGKLTVIEETEKKNGKRMWKCVCDCGNYRICATSELTRGIISSCANCGKKKASQKRRKNIIGNKYGKLTILEIIHRENKKDICKCLCDCGNIIYRDKENLLYKQCTHSCGCAKKEIVRNAVGTNVDGKRFNHLTVIETLWENTPVKLKCVCDCGNEYIGIKSDIVSGHTKSCGCLFKTAVAKANTINYTKIENDYGVIFESPSYKNEQGQWVWQCKCPLCGNYFYTLPCKVINGHTTSCGCQIMSSGEKLIMNYLKVNNIKYASQYSFEDCCYVHKLRFDFIIFDDENIKCAIEYNGKQHYQPIDFFGGENGFKLTQERDLIKTQYCKDNNIPLYVFPYTLTNDQIIKQLSNII